MAMNAHLEIIPLINKIDLPAADPERVRHEIEEGLAVPADEAVLASGKTGEGVRDVLEAVVRHVPPPTGDVSLPLKALIFDSYFDAYRGVVALIRVVDGTVMKGLKVRFMATDVVTDVEEVGVRRPANVPVDELTVGEVGYLITGLKDPSLVKVGDTVTLARQRCHRAAAGLSRSQAHGLHRPASRSTATSTPSSETRSTSSPSTTRRSSTSRSRATPSGFGFRVGFLGLLHMEVIKERLEREFDLELLATAPSVEYHAFLTNGSQVVIHSPQDMPDPSKLDHVEEPFLKTTVIVPPDYVGAVMDLSISRRATFMDMQYLSKTTVELHYEMPLSELIMDFFDQLKSRTKGYASLDYEPIGYRQGNMVKLDILLAGKPVDALSFIVHKDKAYDRGKVLTEKLKTIIPRQMFEVPIQAAIGQKILARETVRAMRKDVIAKCYGGDISRKRKLLEKQKKGKKRMKNIGSVEVPQEAFMAILKVDE